MANSADAQHRHGVRIARYLDAGSDQKPRATRLRTEPATHVLAEAGCPAHAGMDPSAARAILDTVGPGTGQLPTSIDGGRLIFDLPFAVQGRLLRALSETFPDDSYTVTGPSAEYPQWSDTLLSTRPTKVRRHYLLVDDRPTDTLDIEDTARTIRRAAAAAEAAAHPHPSTDSADPIVVCALTEAVEDRFALARQDGLFDGHHRFFVASNIVGGYASVEHRLLRLVVFADPNDPACLRQAAVRALLDDVGQPVPAGFEDDTEAAAWLLRDVLPGTDVRGILRPTRHGPYASCYDSTIVRVTPQYFGQLDQLAAAVTDAVLDRCRGHHRPIEILELGYGTGRLTARLACSLDRIADRVTGPDRPPIELSYQGWDVNGFMTGIAQSRLRTVGAELPISLLVRDLGVDETRTGQFDLIVGSFVTQNWVGQGDDDRSTRFFRWIEALLKPGGRALFLNAFYPDHGRRDSFRANYQRYLTDNLGAEMAAEYSALFPAQLEAPTHHEVQAYARAAGLATGIIEVSDHYPFAILDTTKR